MRIDGVSVTTVETRTDTPMSATCWTDVIRYADGGLWSIYLYDERGVVDGDRIRVQVHLTNEQARRLREELEP